MVRFLKQLFLLLWKNFKLKTSCPWGLIITILELVWPVQLFIVLGGLRLIFPAVEQADDLYRPKALPSAGLLPFMQTLVCDLSDQPISLDTWANTSQDFPDLFPQARLNSMFGDLVDAAEEDFDVDQLCSSAHTLINLTDVLFRTSPQLTVGDFLSAPQRFQSFLEDQYGVDPAVASDLLRASVNTSAAQALLPALPGAPLPLSAEGAGQLLCNTSFLFSVITLPEAELQSLQGSLCAQRNGSTDLGPLVAELNRDINFTKLASVEVPQVGSDPAEVVRDLYVLLLQATRIQRLLGEYSSLGGGANASNGSASGVGGALLDLLCGPGGSLGAVELFLGGLLTRDSRIVASLHHSSDGQLQYKLGHRSFRPKIFYTPVNDLTTSIIQQANRTFSIVGDILSAIDKARGCDQELYNAIPRGSDRAIHLNQLMQWLVGGGAPTVGGFNGIILAGLRASVLSNLSPSNRNQLLDLFNPFAVDNIWTTLERVEVLMASVEEQLEVVDWDVFRGVDSEAELEDWAGSFSRVRAANYSYILAGLVFQEPPAHRRGNASSLTIKIRMNTTYVHETDLIRNKVWYQDPERSLWKKRYFEAGFIFLQDIVERAAVEVLVGRNVTSPGVYIQEMPYPCYKKDRFVLSIQLMLPIITTIAWLFTVAMTVRGVVREKELRLKEVMKMMGLNRLAHWLSWFLTSSLILSVSVVAMVAVLFSFGVLVYSNVFLVWAFLQLYAFVIVLFCFLLSLFFNNANLSASLSGLLYFLTIFLSITVWLKQGEASAFTLALPSLVAPVAFSIGVGYIGQFELQQDGLQFSNVMSSAVQEDHFSFLLASVMLVVDGLLYALLIWYIDAAFPGKYGTAKPWYFPLQPSFWLGKARAKRLGEYLARRSPLSVRAEEGEELLRPLDDLDGEEPWDGPCAPVEPGPESLPIGIDIRNLVKVYSACKCSSHCVGVACGRCRGGGVLAVNGLSLRLYEDQVTAFLGHNGAGKTTTMAILTGLFQPTSGSALINGLDIRTSIDTIRRSLGICPQHNVLFDSLSVEDHLVFFGVLKGLSWKEARLEAHDWLCKVGLEPYAKRKAHKLSGGMKRKLSITLAFVGGSRTIILDEPTSGVDPYARRQIWDFISKSRKGRTIMMATHHMDEAEILGDRIAIISRGELLCAGSYFFLKKHFGRGHKLVVAMQQQQQPGGEESCSEEAVERISQLVGALVPGCQLEGRSGGDLKFLLPLRSCSEPEGLARLFDGLEAGLAAAGGSSYGFAACSLEEVFVRVTAGNGDPDQLSLDLPLDHPDGEGEPPDHDPLKGESPDHHQFKGNSPKLLVRTKETLRDEGMSVSSSPWRHRPPTPDVASLLDTDTEESEEEEEEVFEDSELGQAGALLQPSPSPASCPASCPAPSRLALQLWALLLKRLHYCRQRYLFVLLLNFLPLIVTLLCLAVTRFLSTVPDPVPLTFSTQQYTRSGFDTYMVVGGANSPDACPYLDSLFHPCGVGADALGSSLDPASPCYWPHPHYSTCNSSLMTGFTSPCAPDLVARDDCGATIRPDYAPRPDPASPQCFSAASGPADGQTQGQTFIQDLRHGPHTSYPSNSSDGLVTDYMLWSSSRFIQDRYGGVVFGLERQEVPASVDRTYQDTAKAYLAVRQAAKALFSYKGYHSMPTFLNAVNNAILRANVPPQDAYSYGITTVSHPFATTELQKLEKALESFNFVVNPLGMMFALAFLVSGYCVLIIEERSSKFFHLQEVAGLNKVVYYIAAYIWDTLAYSLFVVLSLALFLAFQDPNFTSPAIFPYFALIMFLFGHALMPWVYSLSLAFTSPTTAFIVLFCLYFFGGFTLMIINSIIFFIIDTDEYGVYLMLWPLPPLPTYTLSRAFGYLTYDYAKNAIDATLNPFGAPVSVGADLAPYIGALLAYAVLGWVVLLLSLYVVLPWVIPLLKCCRSRRASTDENGFYGDDDDVAREHERVSQQEEGAEDVLTTRELSKSYFGHSRRAVNNLSFGVKKGECFGLLGVNGAGKTSTFKMLTGDLAPSGGTARINGVDVRRQLSAARSQVGYCPQFDGLLDSLTGQQHLELFARLRGYRGRALREMVGRTLEQLHLTEYAGRAVSAYSGGNRRKLSTAIALLAQPRIVLLDEPTAGVDPEARRFLWGVVQGVVAGGQSVLLTTHSMAECEVLCSRVAIMVNGQLVCLGSPQHLKEKFGSGYCMKLHLNPDTASAQPLKDFVAEHFSGAELKEEHHNVLIYQWSPPPGGLGGAYRLLPLHQEQLGLEDFSLSQTTLDDVFIHFANHQSDLVTTPPPLPDIISSTSVAMSTLHREEHV